MVDTNRLQSLLEPSLSSTTIVVALLIDFWSLLHVVHGKILEHDTDVQVVVGVWGLKSIGVWDVKSIRVWDIKSVRVWSSQIPLQL